MWGQVREIGTQSGLGAGGGLDSRDNVAQEQKERAKSALICRAPTCFWALVLTYNSLGQSIWQTGRVCGWRGDKHTSSPQVQAEIQTGRKMGLR